MTRAVVGVGVGVVGIDTKEVDSYLTRWLGRLYRVAGGFRSTSDLCRLGCVARVDFRSFVPGNFGERLSDHQFEAQVKLQGQARAKSSPPSGYQLEIIELGSVRLLRPLAVLMSRSAGVSPYLTSGDRALGECGSCLFT